MRHKLTLLALLTGLIFCLPTQAIILDDEAPKPAAQPKPQGKSRIDLKNERMKKELQALKRKQQQEEENAEEEANQKAAQRQKEDEQPIKTAFSLGSKGPGGGIIFNIDSSGHGLEAKASDETGELTWPQAVAAASAYGSGWHLPTKDELYLLYLQRTVVLGFAGNLYWSSTESGSGLAWYRSFYVGNQHVHKKAYTNRVRAVRAF